MKNKASKWNLTPDGYLRICFNPAEEISYFNRQ